MPNPNLPTPSRRRNLSPTLAARADACQHLWYLECHGELDLTVEPDAGTRLRIQRGNEKPVACWLRTSQWAFASYWGHLHSRGPPPVRCFGPGP